MMDPQTIERKPFFERIEEGFLAAIEHAQGKRRLRTTHLESIAPPVQMSAADIHSLRERLSLSQEALAKILCVSLSSVRSWEQGSRKPSGVVLRLLSVIENPKWAKELQNRLSHPETKSPKNPIKRRQTLAG